MSEETREWTGRKLRQSERRYRDLFEGSRDAILITTRAGEFLEVNDAACALTQYPREELLRIKAPDVYADPSVRTRFQEQVEKNGFVTEFPMELRTKSGVVRECLVSSTAYRNMDGAIEGYQTIMRDVTEHNQLHRQLQQDQYRLRSLGVELATTEDRERRALAEDLHDGIGQSLALAQMRVQMLTRASGARAVRLRQELSDLIRQMENDVRVLIFALSPPVLYEIGLGAAIEWFGEQLTERGGPLVTVEDDEWPNAVNHDVLAVLFRCVRELLVNVEKHAAASRVRVQLAHQDDEIRVEVEDDGKGFDTGKVMSNHTHYGFGLFSIRDRMDFLGGSCQLHSELGKGTRCVLIWPLLGSETEGGGL